MNIIINPEFERLIPPLSADEAVQLEALLVAEGIRDALVIARYPNDDGEEIQHLADGHNRLRIAQKHGLDYRTEIKDFPGEDDVVIWMIDNQKGRRNLTDFVKLELAEVKAERLRKKGREKQKETLKQGPVLSIIDKTEAPHNTRNEIAADLGWSTGKVAMGQKVMKEAPEAIKAQVRTGEVSISQAYQAIRKEQKIEAVRQAEQAHREELPLVDDFQVDIYSTEKKFSIIYADPAWDYWEGGQKNQSLHYSTMTMEDICALPVERIADENAILFLWVTYPILPEALRVIERWGFKYSTCGFVWVKRNKNAGTWFFGNGAWTRANTELCLIAKRGNVTRIDASISQIIDDPISEHSRKPERVRGLITQLVGELPRIELFSRNQNNDGWFNWGNGI